MTRYEDTTTLRLALQVRLLGSIPFSVRAIWAGIAGDAIRVVGIYEREPSSEERELLQDAALDAAGDFARLVTADIEYWVSDEPITNILRERGLKSTGFLIYLRYEDDRG